jgi:hypothetical protein
LPVLLCFIVPAVFVLARTTGDSTAKREAADRTFAITTDPAIAVLSLTAYGSMSGRTLIYNLYGDGRLVKVLQELGQEATQMETQLSFEEVMALVGEVVRSGLASAEREDLLARKRTLSGGRLGPPPEDSARQRLEIRLTDLGGNGPVSTVIDGSGLVESTREPLLPEVAAWHRVVNDFSARFPGVR